MFSAILGDVPSLVTAGVVLGLSRVGVFRYAIKPRSRSKIKESYLMSLLMDTLMERKRCYMNSFFASSRTRCASCARSWSSLKGSRSPTASSIFRQGSARLRIALRLRARNHGLRATGSIVFRSDQNSVRSHENSVRFLKINLLKSKLRNSSTSRLA